MDRSGDPFAKFVNNALEKITGVNAVEREDQAREVRRKRDDEFMRRIADGLGGFAARIELLTDNTRAIFTALERLGDAETRLNRSYDIEDALRKRADELAAAEADARVEIARLQGELALAENKAARYREDAESSAGTDVIEEAAAKLSLLPSETARALRECFSALEPSLGPAVADAVKNAISQAASPADSGLPAAIADVEEKISARISAAFSAIGEKVSEILAAPSPAPDAGAAEKLDRIAAVMEKLEAGASGGASTATIEQLRRELTENSAAAGALEAEKRAASELRAQFDAKCAEAARLRDSIEEQKRIADDLRERIDTMEASIAAARELDEEEKRASAELREQFDAKCEEAERLRNELEEQKRSADELRVRIESMAISLAAANEPDEEKNRTSDELRASLEAKCAEADLIRGALEEQKRSAGELRERISSVEASLSEARSSLEAEQAASEQLREEIGRLRSEAAAASTAASASPDIVQGYEKMLLDRDEKISALEAESAGAMARIDDAEARLAEALEAGKRAMAREAARDGEIASAWHECETLQNKIKELESRPEPSVSPEQVEALEKEREHARTRIARLEKENAELAGQVEEFKKREEGAGEVDRLVKATLAEAESRANKLRDELSTLEREKESLAQKHNETVEQNARAIAANEAKYDELRLAFNDMEQRNRELEEASRQRGEEIASLKSGLKKAAEAHAAEIENLHEYIGEQQELLEYYVEKHRVAAIWGPLTKVFDRFSAAPRYDAAPGAPDGRPATD